MRSPDPDFSFRFAQGRPCGLTGRSATPQAETQPVAAFRGPGLWEAIYADADVPSAFAPDVALNALVRERRHEFFLPETPTKPCPDAEAVLENKRAGGQSRAGDGAFAAGRA